MSTIRERAQEALARAERKYPGNTADWLTGGGWQQVKDPAGRDAWQHPSLPRVFWLDLSMVVNLQEAMEAARKEDVPVLASALLRLTGPEMREKVAGELARYFGANCLRTADAAKAIVALITREMEGGHA